MFSLHSKRVYKSNTIIGYINKQINKKQHLLICDVPLKCVEFLKNLFVNQKQFLRKFETCVNNEPALYKYPFFLIWNNL